MDLQGYKSKFYLRKDNSGHGGIAVLYKTSLTLLSSTQFDSSQFENCTFGTNSRHFDYATVYRPPVSDKNRLSKSKFIDDFSDFLHQYGTVTTPLLVVGDFNIHVDNPQDPSVRNFSDLLASLNFHQHVNVPTHQSGHTLDLVISRNGDSLVHDVQVKHMVADHNLILISLKLTRERNTIKEIRVRNWRKIDIDSFKSDINTALLSQETSAGPSVILDELSSVLTDTLESHAPSFTKTVVIRPQHVWFTEDLNKLNSVK